MQRLCDSYHGVIGSVAVSILVDVIYSDTDLHNDKAIKDFCTMALEDDRFIYSDSEDKQPEVTYSSFEVQSKPY
jgi:hypothetical protein